jgi:catechol 2,3-dioxygenase-like lactoylglutathione lyase family enzyme
MGETMSRVQLGLNVSDIDSAVAFYEKAFGVTAAKRRPGYANFEIAEPPLKLVLFERPDGGTINHLGVEVDDTADVHRATRHLRSVGLDTRIEDGVDCCHAVQDKVWATDPDGLEWEWYTVLADSPVPEATDPEPACC